MVRVNKKVWLGAGEEMGQTDRKWHNMSRSPRQGTLWDVERMETGPVRQKVRVV